MNPDGKAGKCLAVLREGPATTEEVAAETGLPSKSAGTHLRNLFDRGKATREKFIKAEGRGRRQCWLWSAA